MLQYNPADRITAAAALEHPYFDDVQLPDAMLTSKFYKTELAKKQAAEVAEADEDGDTTVTQTQNGKTT